MRDEFTAIVEGEGNWFIAYSPEVPGANGHGRAKDEARESLAAAISLILENRRADGFRGLPPDAERGTVIVECSGARCPDTFIGMIATSSVKAARKP